ncbi:hypothetical protein DENSPDRAFT_892589 [Dentipellis sp. KUC8613]|nr:hypothetical protein DENSPDRAFT_892589 [Dentipellis sp. KUC8613]
MVRSRLRFSLRTGRRCCDKTRSPDGAPTSLVGCIDPREMGSRVQRQAPNDIEKKKKKAADNQDPTERQLTKREAEAPGFGYFDIIEVTQDVEGLIYRPQTAETRELYELILLTVHQALGDQAQDVVRSAADTVLDTLKNEGMKDFDKKEVEEVVGSIPNEAFSQLVNLSRSQITVDEEMGVAVVFNEEEQESKEEEGFEIRDDSDDEENETAEGGVSEVYPDPVSAADKAASVLSILGSESSLRDAENQLSDSAMNHF